jgi:hypothetical protein
MVYWAWMVSVQIQSATVYRTTPAAMAREEAAGLSAPPGDPGGTGPPLSQVPSILPLEVRSLAPRDVAGLRRLDPLFRLNQPDLQLEAYRSLRAALAAAVPGLRGRRPAFVACAGERLVGFAQFQSGQPDQRWLLLALGASVGVFDADPVWEALLAHAVRSAGLRGVKRLYARVARGLPFLPALRRFGWTPYASETVYAAHDLTPPRRESLLRPQEPSDTWAIHQLYMAAVPRPIHDTEAYTSHHWEMRGGRGRPRITTAGWLVEDRHQVIGYARTTSRPAAVVLELLYHPEHIEILPELIGGALAAVPFRRLRRVYCAVRGYQAEAATALSQAGLAPSLEQDLLVKYTTANVRPAPAEAVPFHLDVREKLPRRVPTFLQGQPGD